MQRLDQINRQHFDPETSARTELSLAEKGAIILELQKQGINLDSISPESKTKMQHLIHNFLTIQSNVNPAEWLKLNPQDLPNISSADLLNIMRCAQKYKEQLLSLFEEEAEVAFEWKIFKSNVLRTIFEECEFNIMSYDLSSEQYDELLIGVNAERQKAKNLIVISRDLFAYFDTIQSWWQEAFPKDDFTASGFIALALWIQWHLANSQQQNISILLDELKPVAGQNSPMIGMYIISQVQEILAEKAGLPELQLFIFSLSQLSKEFTKHNMSMFPAFDKLFNRTIPTRLTVVSNARTENDEISLHDHFEAVGDDFAKERYVNRIFSRTTKPYSLKPLFNA